METTKNNDGCKICNGYKERACAPIQLLLKTQQLPQMQKSEISKVEITIYNAWSIELFGNTELLNLMSTCRKFRQVNLTRI